ncbi:helix-turn-helix transcriptional regulator [Micromonospora sp. CA-240977]|uniref:helix-turn-helix transcriptional regulator n=1 Tax=Micromonospora sp. CA-240977 TaxID=3239957 RepID=UPI003D8A6804
MLSGPGVEALGLGKGRGLFLGPGGRRRSGGIEPVSLLAAHFFPHSVGQAWNGSGTGVHVVATPRTAAPARTRSGHASTQAPTVAGAQRGNGAELTHPHCVARRELGEWTATDGGEGRRYVAGERRRHRLAQRRQAIGLSQERLAEALGVDRSTIVRWERAATDPQPWHRPRLAAALMYGQKSSRWHRHSWRFLASRTPCLRLARKGRRREGGLTDRPQVRKPGCRIAPLGDQHNGCFKHVFSSPGRTNEQGPDLVVNTGPGPSSCTRWRVLGSR